MKTNISKVRDCYGCGVCAIICPKQIIRLELNNNGFYQPKIINNECTNCKLCLSVCSYSHNELALATSDQIEGYAAWSNNGDIRYKCSSGGIAFEFGRHLLKHGYKACGVKYNVKLCRAEHFIADNEIDYQLSIGSKYIQSYTVDAFASFKKDEKYLVTGTPCQIDSLRRYIRIKKIEENFLLLDFFCHGVPSILLWKKYTRNIEMKIGELSEISWRDKKNGWHDSYEINAFANNSKDKFSSKLSDGDVFFNLFLTDTCLGKACFSKCKYKGKKSSADIRVGDLWGTKYMSNDIGISGVLAFTEIGKSNIRQLNDCILIPENLDVIIGGQIKKPLKKTIVFSLTMFMLKTQLPLCKIYNITRLFKKIVNFYTIAKSKAKRILA